MSKFKFTGVFLFCAMLVKIEGVDDVSTADFKAAMAEIKTEFQNLKDIMLGRCRKLEPESACSLSQTGNCPDGFIYLPLAQSCYRVVYEAQTWASADAICRQLYTGARLAAITSPAENDALKSFMRLDFATNPASAVCASTDYGPLGKVLWVSGQRLDENSCTDPFVWKLSTDQQLPFAFTDWHDGEPNCGFSNTEQCVHLATGFNNRWNDASCSFKMCALCEYQPA